MLHNRGTLEYGLKGPTLLELAYGLAGNGSPVIDPTDFGADGVIDSELVLELGFDESGVAEVFGMGNVFILSAGFIL
ncbi:unnamed protein product [Ambrosiozyma monospora]|uniref:Unnamed protein product n=1 Tax=Ambrosiozyma monospora TaxID=43982 RepID=A0ACB5U9X0_AMBMO|nr:unnamed protein product [Ambrosiozyma monospora]